MIFGVLLHSCFVLFVRLLSALVSILASFCRLTPYLAGFLFQCATDCLGLDIQQFRGSGLCCRHYVAYRLTPIPDHRLSPAFLCQIPIVRFCHFIPMANLGILSWNLQGLTSHSARDWVMLTNMCRLHLVCFQELTVQRRAAIPPTYANLDLAGNQVWREYCPPRMYDALHRFYGTAFAGILLLDPTLTVRDTHIQDRVTSLLIAVTPTLLIRVTSVYAPVIPSERRVWASQLQTLLQHQLAHENHLVLGDWNDVPAPIDSSTDRSAFTVWDALESCLSGFSDIFRVLYPTRRAFSHTAIVPNSTSFARLDAIYASAALCPFALYSRYLSTFSSDHNPQLLVQRSSVAPPCRPLRFTQLSPQLISFPAFAQDARRTLTGILAPLLTTGLTLSTFFDALFAIRSAALQLSAYHWHSAYLLNQTFEQQYSLLRHLPLQSASDFHRFLEQAAVVSDSATASGFTNHARRSYFFEPPPLRPQHTATHVPLAMADVVSFYTHLFTPAPSTPHTTQARQTLLTFHSPRLTTEERTALIRPFTEDEVTTALTHHGQGRAAGPDGLSYDFWRLSPLTPALIAAAANLLMQRNSRFPLLQPRARGVLLYKGRGSPQDVTRYRPLTLLDAIIRLIDSLFAARLQHLSPTLFPIAQYGFISARSAWMCGIQLHMTMANVLSGLGDDDTIVIVNQDQRKAYDLVHRQWLFEVFRRIHLPPAIQSYFLALYHNLSIVYAVGDDLSPPIPQRRGIPQGLPSSCLVYNIAYQPFLSALHAHGITPLTYADNTVVILRQHQLDDYLHLRQLYDLASDAQLNIDTRAHIVTRLPTPPAWALHATTTINPDADRNTATIQEISYLGFSFRLTPTIPNLALSTATQKMRTRLAPRFSWQAPMTTRIQWVNSHALPMLWHALTVGPISIQLFSSLRSILQSWLFRITALQRPWITFDHIQLPIALGGFGLMHVEAMHAALQGQTYIQCLNSPDTEYGRSFRQQLSQFYIQHMQLHPSALFTENRPVQLRQNQAAHPFWAQVAMLLQDLDIDLADEALQVTEPQALLALPWWHSKYDINLTQPPWTNFHEIRVILGRYGYITFGDLLYKFTSASGSTMPSVPPMHIRHTLPQRAPHLLLDTPATSPSRCYAIDWLHRHWAQYMLLLPAPLLDNLMTAINSHPTRPPTVAQYAALTINPAALPLPPVTLVNMRHYSVKSARRYWLCKRHPLLDPDSHIHIPTINNLPRQPSPATWARLWRVLAQTNFPPLAAARFSTLCFLHGRSLSFRLPNMHLAPCPHGCVPTNDDDPHKYNDHGVHAYTQCPHIVAIWQALWPHAGRWAELPATMPTDCSEIFAAWPALPLNDRSRHRLHLWHMIVVGAIASARNDSIRAASARRRAHTTSDLDAAAPDDDEQPQVTSQPTTLGTPPAASYSLAAVYDYYTITMQAFGQHLHGLSSALLHSQTLWDDLSARLAPLVDPLQPG